jgi:hypothetical protein
MWARHVAERLGRSTSAPFTNAIDVVTPLSECSLQHVLDAFTLPMLFVAAVGVVLALRSIATRPCNVAWPLTLGGVAYACACSGHESTAPLILLAPGLLAFAALSFEALAPRLAKLRAGLAPLVVAVSTLGLFGIQRTNELRYAARARDASESSTGAAAPDIAMPDECGADIASLVPNGAFVVHPSTLALDLAVDLYAWRSTCPIASADDSRPDALAQQIGLGAAQRWLVMPNAPPPRAQAQCAELRAKLTHGRAADASNARWSAWRLR